MRRLITTITFLFIILLCSQSVLADYLIVSRSATIKAEAHGKATILDRVVKGQILILLDSVQSKSGYYRVKNPENSIVGWIYRTLVRRYEGNPPGYNENYDITKGDLVVTVVDVGAGLCNIIQLPNGQFILFDAGHYRGYGNSSFRQIQEVMPLGSEIEIMVLSHTDSDHIGAAGHVLKNYRVKKLLRTGYEKSAITSSTSDKPTATYKRLTDALGEIEYPIEDINLNLLDSTISPSSPKIEIGLATIQFLAGFGEPMDEWGLKSRGERINAVSIVMRLEYQGTSVLFTGDAVGRHIDAADDALMATEKYLIDNAKELLDVDVLIAPHHGADNGSSTAFIQATSPQKVIFSAGHNYKHPRKVVAERYLANGVKLENIYRTDRGDDERGSDSSLDKEWSYQRIADCIDSYSDDDVKIVIDKDGALLVYYLKDNKLCNE